MSKLQVYAWFESQQTDDEGAMDVRIDADRDKVVYGLRDMYDALPEFIQDQVQSLRVTDDEVDVDIIELSIGRKIRLQKEEQGV